MAFHGIFIGVDRHASPEIQELSCAARDASALAALFEDTLGLGTPGTGMTLLVDGQATHEAISRSFEQLAFCAADDTVFIAFSGHGSEDHKLVAHDTDLDDLDGTAISLDALQNAFSQIPAKRLVLVLDCCFSGGIGSKVLRLDARARDIPSAEARLGQLAGEGRIIFTASSASEAAWENTRHGHGLLTHHLIEALVGAEEVRDGSKISLLKLLKHVTERVQSSAAAIGRAQTPAIRGALDGDVVWPIFVRGARWNAAFPRTAPVRVSAKIESLVDAGFPADLVAAWAAAIPSLNPLQIAAINDFGLLQGEHLVVSAPTSSGKTMIGELAALRGVMGRRRAIFLLPLKALVADKKRHFDRVYGNFGIRTFEATGETDDITPLLRGHYDIALLTYEKFAAIALTFPHVVEQAGVIVVDEAQMIADQGRGASLEFLLTLLRMRRRADVEPQIIALSAVIGGTGGFEDWLGGRLLRRTERPVPLDEGLLLADGSFMHLDAITGAEARGEPVINRIYGKGSSQDWIIPLVRKLVADGQQVIVFREQKGQARGCANYLAEALGLPSAIGALARLPASDPSQASQALRTCLAGGAAFHHADLTAEERRVVEEEFRRDGSNLRIIAATTTLAMGVNTPANSVIICGLDHPGSNGPIPYSVAEYKNLVGRAGRLGYAEHGTSYLLALSPRAAHDLWHRYVTASPEDLHSRFLASDTDPRTLIIRVIASAQRMGAGATRQDVIAFLESSFGAFQQSRAQEGWRLDEGLIEEAMHDLEHHGLVESGPEGTLVLTALGRVAGESGAEVTSVLRLVAALRGLGADQVTDPVLITAVQATAELDGVLFPMNRKSTQRHHKEPQAWRGELRQQGIPSSVMAALGREAREEHLPTLRAKKAVAALLFVSGRSMADIEQSLTKFGGGFNGAAGPIRAAAARTADLLPVVAQIAEILVPELELGSRVERLLIRLTYGVPATAVDLAREAGAQLTRGDYCALASQGLTDPGALEDAGDEQLMEQLGGDSAKVEIARAAAQAAVQRRESAKRAAGPILDAYVG